MSCFLFLFFFFTTERILVFYLAVPLSTQDLSFLTRVQTHGPCAEVQALNHWTTREVPACLFAVKKLKHEGLVQSQLGTGSLGDRHFAALCVCVSANDHQRARNFGFGVTYKF